MLALALIPLAALLLFTACLHLDPGPQPLRRTLISAAAGTGIIIVALTEILGALRALDRPGVVTAWLLVDAGLLAVNLRLGRPPFAGRIGAFHAGRLVGVLGAGGGLIAGTTLLIAVAAPPNNWDAMTYHMARLVHWIDSGSVDFYAVEYLAQLYQGPWSGYARLHVVLLGDGDQAVNLVQWASFVGCALVASLIAAQLGAGRLGQLCAALFVVTLPMAILQASSAQDHLAVSFWLLCLASLVILVRDHVSWRLTLEASVCLGLAILTKGTAYVLALPLIVLAAWWLGRGRPLALVRHAGVAALIVVALNALHWLRNLAAFGWPLGPRAETAYYSVSEVTPTTFVEKVIQDYALQLAVPIRSLNDALSRVIESGAAALGLDLADPATTWGSHTWTVPPFTTHEDYAGNLLATVLLTAVMPLMLLRGRGVGLRYAMVVIAATLLFVAYIRWQPWNSRLYLPLFILAAPLVGAMVGGWRRSIVATLCVVLLLGSGVWVVLGKARPLVGAGSVLTTDRTSQYFANHRALEGAYRQIAAAIDEAGCRDVGFHVVSDDPWEYPLWVLLNQKERTVLRDVMVTNETARLEPDHPPCAIVFGLGGPTTPQRYRGIDYAMVLDAKLASLYRPVAR